MTSPIGTSIFTHYSQSESSPTVRYSASQLRAMKERAESIPPATLVTATIAAGVFNVSTTGPGG